jgi:hypothetical protein
VLAQYLQSPRGSMLAHKLQPQLVSLRVLRIKAHDILRVLDDIPRRGTRSSQAILHVLQRTRNLLAERGGKGTIREGADLPGDGNEFCAVDGENADVRVGWFWRGDVGWVEGLGQGFGGHC